MKTIVFCVFGFDALFYFFFFLDDLFLNCRRIHPDTDRKKKLLTNKQQ